MPYEYFLDVEHLNNWLKAEENPETYKEFIEKNIYNCKNFNEYLNLNGGLEKMRKLRNTEYSIDKEI